MKQINVPTQYIEWTKISLYKALVATQADWNSPIFFDSDSISEKLEVKEKNDERETTNTTSESAA